MASAPEAANGGAAAADGPASRAAEPSAPAAAGAANAGAAVAVVAPSAGSAPEHVPAAVAGASDRPQLSEAEKREAEIEKKAEAIKVGTQDVAHACMHACSRRIVLEACTWQIYLLCPNLAGYIYFCADVQADLLGYTCISCVCRKHGCVSC